MWRDSSVIPGGQEDRVSQKKYTKLIKRNLKLITLVNNMQLFLNVTPSNLNFEPACRNPYGFLNMNFKLEILANLEFLGVSNLSTSYSS